MTLQKKGHIYLKGKIALQGEYFGDFKTKPFSQEQLSQYKLKTWLKYLCVQGTHFLREIVFQERQNRLFFLYKHSLVQIL